MLRRALVFKVSRRTNCVAMTVSRVLVDKLLLDLAVHAVRKKGLSRQIFLPLFFSSNEIHPAPST
jgi:hypothetical protein